MSSTITRPGWGAGRFLGMSIVVPAPLPGRMILFPETGGSRQGLISMTPPASKTTGQALRCLQHHEPAGDRRGAALAHRDFGRDAFGKSVRMREAADIGERMREADL